MAYKDDLDQIIADIAVTLGTQEVYLKDVFPVLKLDEDNTKLRDFLIKQGVCTLAGWRKELLKFRTEEDRKANIAKHLGAMPETPIDFVFLFAEKNNIALTLSGLLTCQGRSYSLETMTDQCIIEAKSISMDYPTDLVRSLVNNWQYEYINRLKEELRLKVAYAAPESEDAAAAVRDDWHFIGGLFVEPFAADIIRKHMWMVKRKMNGMKVPMPILWDIYGVQRNGKSWFLKALLSVVGYCDTSFGQMVDDRNKTLWDNYQLYVGEMRKPEDRTINMDTVKHNVTADVISTRTMRTGTTTTFLNNAVTCGDSNYPLNTILYDPTGMGRFVQCEWKTIPDENVLDERGCIETMGKYLTWERINMIDWLALWKSVDETADDPAAKWSDEIKAQQEELTTFSNVEEWLNDPLRDEHRKFDRDTIEPKWEGKKNTRRLRKENFAPWCIYNGYKPMGERLFGIEMKRIAVSMPRLKYTNPCNLSTWELEPLPEQPDAEQYANEVYEEQQAAVDQQRQEKDNKLAENMMRMRSTNRGY